MTRRKGYLALLSIGLFTLSFILWGCGGPADTEPAANEGDNESSEEIDVELEDEYESDDELIMNDDDLTTLEGTVVDILEYEGEEEILFVAQLNLSDEELGRTFDEWLESDQQSDVYRLNGIGSNVSIGDEIRISFAITTMSIPPFVPVVEYEMIR